MTATTPLIDPHETQAQIKRLARRISRDYQGRNLVCIGVLKGAFIFMADLVREITLPLEIDFVGASSYGAGTDSSGSIKLTKEISVDLQDKDVLLVEDIVDTGLTLEHLVAYMESFAPRSVKICALIDKHQRRKTDVRVAYACHVVEEGFLVGYGLDHNEFYRNLPGICRLDP